MVIDEELYIDGTLNILQKMIIHCKMGNHFKKPITFLLEKKMKDYFFR